LAALEVVVGGRGDDGRFGLALGAKQREMLAPAHDRAGLVPSEVGGDGEQPGARVLGLLAERADEGLLRQVLRTLRVPHLAVEEADQVTVGRAVHVRPIDAHGCPIRPACETPPPGGSWTRCVVYSPGGPQRNAMPRTTCSSTGTRRS